MISLLILFSFNILEVCLVVQCIRLTEAGKFPQARGAVHGQWRSSTSFLVSRDKLLFLMSLSTTSVFSSCFCYFSSFCGEFLYLENYSCQKIPHKIHKLLPVLDNSSDILKCNDVSACSVLLQTAFTASLTGSSQGPSKSTGWIMVFNHLLQWSTYNYIECTISRMINMTSQ